MKEIVNRLHENRQIQLAKEILESNGYKVSKNRVKESSDMSLDIPEIDFSHIEGAKKYSETSPIIFNTTKAALQYKKEQGMALRQMNNLTSDEETEIFCDQLRDKLVSNLIETGHIDKDSKEYQALLALASTLKGHTLSRYGMYSAYVDIKSKSPYSVESILTSNS